MINGFFNDKTYDFQAAEEDHPQYVMVDPDWRFLRSRKWNTAILILINKKER